MTQGKMNWVPFFVLESQTGSICVYDRVRLTLNRIVKNNEQMLVQINFQTTYMVHWVHVCHRLTKSKSNQMLKMLFATHSLHLFSFFLLLGVGIIYRITTVWYRTCFIAMKWVGDKNPVPSEVHISERKAEEMLTHNVNYTRRYLVLRCRNNKIEVGMIVCRTLMYNHSKRVHSPFISC